MFAYDAFVHNGEPVTVVWSLFRTHFNLGRRDTVPQRNTILTWVHTIRTTGSIIKKKHPGPLEDYKGAWKHQESARSTHAEPKSLSEKTLRKLRLMCESERTMLLKDLKFYLYKMCVMQKLSKKEYKLDFALRMLVLHTEGANRIIIMSDETHFHLTGEVNKQNLRYCGSARVLA